MSTTLYKIKDHLGELSEYQKKDEMDTEQEHVGIDLDNVTVEIDIPSPFGVEAKEGGEKVEQLKKCLEWLGKRATSLTINFKVNPRAGTEVESMLPRMLGMLEGVKVESLGIVEPVDPDDAWEDWRTIPLNNSQTVALFTALAGLLEKNPHIQSLNTKDTSLKDWFNRYAGDDGFHHKHLRKKINSLILKNKGLSLEGLEKIYDSLENARQQLAEVERELKACTSETTKKYIIIAHKKALLKVEAQKKQFDDTVRLLQEKGIVEAHYYVGQELQLADPRAAYGSLLKVANESTLPLYCQKANFLIATMLIADQRTREILPLLLDRDTDRSSTSSSESPEKGLEEDSESENERKRSKEKENKYRAEDLKTVVEAEDLRKAQMRFILTHALRGIEGPGEKEKQDCQALVKPYIHDYVYDQGSLDTNTVSAFQRLPATAKIVDVTIFLLDRLREAEAESRGLRAELQQLRKAPSTATLVTPPDTTENLERAEVQVQPLQQSTGALPLPPRHIVILPDSTENQSPLIFSSSSAYSSSSISTIPESQNEPEKDKSIPCLRHTH